MIKWNEMNDTDTMRTKTPVKRLWHSDRLSRVPRWLKMSALVALLVTLGFGLAALLFGVATPTNTMRPMAGGMAIPFLGMFLLSWTVAILSLLAATYLLFETRSATDDEQTAESPTRHATAPRVDVSILPDDERQVLAPVVADPGLTQIEVTDRTGLSKAKVSQTLTALRERGLVYRESAGRTYRLYSGKRLDDNATESVE